MLTVTELIAQLSTLRGDVPVRSLVIERQGQGVDAIAGTPCAINTVRGDSGDVEAVWIVSRDYDARPPAQLVAVCHCGEIVTQNLDRCDHRVSWCEDTTR